VPPRALFPETMFNCNQFDRTQQRDKPTVNVTIQTPNPQAFQASKTQVAASLARAVQAGMRGL
jgi:hypothetical protein